MQKIEFRDLQPVDKLSKVEHATAEYMQTVESRVERANVSLLTGNIARYEALHLTGRQISRVVWDMGDQILLGSGMLGVGDVDKAIAGGMDASNDFIGRLRFMANMSPEAGTFTAIKDFDHTLGDEQLRLAHKCTQIILDRFPGLGEQLEDSHGDLDRVLDDYFADKGGGRYKAPEYMRHIAYFTRDMKAWKQMSEEGQIGFAERAYHNAHLKRHQMMDYIKGMAISVPEQRAVDKIVDFDRSGPHFIDYNLLSR